MRSTAVGFFFAKIAVRIFGEQQDRLSNCQPAESAQCSAIFVCGVMKTPRKNLDGQATIRTRERPEAVEIWKARKVIDEHSDEELPLTRVAKSVHISPNYLSEKFKEVTGVNFVQYVTRTRISKARVLLRDSNQRVSEIAFAVGFQSLSQFNRAFKKVTRQTPTGFRAEARQSSNAAPKTPRNIFRKNA
jgi:AraC-like DNA-binding protein